MNLDQNLQPKSAALDITPLIDVVFLLVLFFAVTTSFISPEDLDTLRQNVQTLQITKDELTADVQRQRIETERTQTQLADVETTLAEVRNTLALTREESAAARREADGNAALLATANNALTGARIATEQLQTQLTASRDAQSSLQTQLAVSRDAQARLQEQLVAAENARDRLQEQLINEREDQASYQEQMSAFRALEEKLRAQITALSEQNANLTQQTGELREELANTNEQAERYKSFYDANEERVEQVTRAEQTLVNGFNAMDLNSVLNVERQPNQLTIQLSNQILFDSGSADLKFQGLDVLRRVGRVLKDKLGDMVLQVGGHTDNVPIRGGRFANNWDLSAARAVNVVDFLEQDVGIDASLLSGVGYGEYRPIAPNDTAENRALNRRIELVLLPR